MHLTQIEAAFKCSESELGIRPIYHQFDHRVAPYIPVAFLAYCLMKGYVSASNGYLLPIAIPTGLLNWPLPEPADPKVLMRAPALLYS
jgi:hypothetical protein